MNQEEAFRIVSLVLNPSSTDALFLGEFTGLSNSDWEEVSYSAALNGLNLLFYHHLKKRKLLAVVPDTIKADLEKQFFAATARNMRMIHLSGEILQAFLHQGVNVIVLKGLYLAENIYPTIGLRVFGDVDLLVRREDVDKGLAVLQGMGYQLSTYYDPQDPNRDIKHLPPLEREDGPTIELHWSILEEEAPFDIRIDDLWNRAQPVNVAGVDVLALGSEDQILHLAMHASYLHGFRGGIRPLYDIAAVLQKWQGQMQWDRLALTAREWGAQRVLWLTLTLVTEVTGVEVPEEFMKNLLGEPEDPSIIKEARMLLVPDHGEPVNLTPDLVALQSLKGPGAKFKLLLSRIFLPRRIMARLYNVDPRSARVYGYYPIRFFQLLGRYYKSGCGLVSKDQGVLVSIKREETNEQLIRWLTQK